MDLSFIIAWLMPHSAVISLTAHTSTLTLIPPTPAQILQLLADWIEIHTVALPDISGLRLKERGRVRCWLR